MKIYPFSLGELQANCYLLQEGNEALLIDPGDDASFLLEEVQRRNLTLIGILATHGHFDHVMAVGELQLGVNVPLYIHKKDEFLITRLESTAEHFLHYRPVVIPPKNMRFIQKGQMSLSQFSFEVIETPGHTPGSVCYYSKSEQILFTGDTLFMGAVGRTDLSYSNRGDLTNSLHLLATYPEETIIYPGHGEETILANEKNVTLF